MFITIKKFFADFYRCNGRSIGMFLLTNVGIAMLFMVGILLIGQQSITLGTVLGLLISLPLFATIVAIVRCIIRLVHKIIPMAPGLVKFVFDFVIMGVVLMLLGFWFRGIQMVDSDVFQTILFLLFDALYIFLTVLLLNANKNKKDKTLSGDKE